jgi:hypothetical protein
MRSDFTTNGTASVKRNPTFAASSLILFSYRGKITTNVVTPLSRKNSNISGRSL